MASGKTQMLWRLDESEPTHRQVYLIPVSTRGHVSADTIKKYVEEQKGT